MYVQTEGYKPGKWTFQVTEGDVVTFKFYTRVIANYSNIKEFALTIIGTLIVIHADGFVTAFSRLGGAIVNYTCQQLPKVIDEGFGNGILITAYYATEIHISHL